MKKIICLLMALCMVVGLSACSEQLASSGADTASESVSLQSEESKNRDHEPDETASALNEETEEGEATIQIKISVDDTELYATFENNATTQSLIERMPMTLSMSDLYDREMCYRYGAYALPTDELRTDGYEIGDIAYWPPGGSLVILYEQNGEQFERQHLGHIDSGVEIFEQTGDFDVTFEVISE